MTYIEDSDRRCPYDSKRMLVEVGQDDEGWTRMVHFCLNCDYHEEDRAWRSRLPTRSAARLKAMRLGWEIPLVYEREESSDG